MSYDDVDVLIDALDQVKGQIDNPDALKKFVLSYADDLIALLNELKEQRETAASGHAALIKKNVHRRLIEGFSEDNIHEAFSKALGKVSAYFSEDHDVSVSVIGLVDLPKGGHRATLEVHITPIKLSLKKQVADIDKKYRRQLAKEDLELLKRQENYHLQHLVLEHFVHRSGQSPIIPDHLMLHIHEVDILKKMMEKGFFQAAHTPHPAAPKTKIIIKPPEYNLDKT